MLVGEMLAAWLRNLCGSAMESVMRTVMYLTVFKAFDRHTSPKHRMFPIDNRHIPSIVKWRLDDESGTNSR